MKVDVFDVNKNEVGEVELSDEVAEAPVRKHLFWEVVKWQQARRRAGTHDIKKRSEVRGGGAKPWQQKGTGRARHGSIRSPIWVGGGAAHGKDPKNYDYKLPKSKRFEALRSAMSMKIDSNEFFVVESFDLDEIKTQKAVEMIEAFDASSALVVDSTLEADDGSIEHNDILRLSVRNLPDTKYLAVEGLNVEDILNHDLLLISQDALEDVDERLSDE